jgi:uncharacterized integral membrane protein (TIGR00698 family)
MTNIRQYAYGLVLCSLIGIISLFLGDYTPLGAVTVAIVLGIVIGNLAKLGDRFEKGIKFSEKRVLPFAIGLMGVNLNYLVLKELGFQSLLLVMAGIVVTIFASVFLAKIFAFDQKMALLLGIGNGICGSSAIAATEHIIGVEKKDVGLSIAIVNFLGTIGMFLLPVIATLFLKLDSLNSGLLIGNTLQAVGNVVAAGFSVKMARILMLTPVIFVLLFVFTGAATPKGKTRKAKIYKIPLFIFGFIAFSLIPTFSLLPAAYIAIISKASHYALVVAMAGIGLKTTIASILKDGKSALLIGSLTFLVQIAFSSGAIFLFMR